MDAAKPRLEIGKHKVNDWQVSLRDFRVTPLCNRSVTVSTLGKAGVAFSIIRDDDGLRRYGFFDETAKRLGGTVRQQAEPDSTSISPILAFVQTAGALSLANLDDPGYRRHIVNTSPLTTGATTNPRFICLDMDVSGSPNLVLVWAHHSNTQFVKNLEGRFVARKPKLTLKLNRRNAWHLTGYQVSGPEPYGKWRMGALHDGASSKVGVVLAKAAPKNCWTIGKPIRGGNAATCQTNERATPACAFKIGCAGSLIREQLLELRQ